MIGSPKTLHNALSVKGFKKASPAGASRAAPRPQRAGSTIAESMEKNQEAGEILMNSLLLLGVQTTLASREYGCEIRSSMFAQPNQKGLNTMLHLLMERIRGREGLRKARMLSTGTNRIILLVIVPQSSQRLPFKGLTNLHLASGSY